MNPQDIIKLFNLATTPIILTDAEGSVLAVNNALNRLLTRDTANEFSWDELISEKERHYLRQNIESCLKNETIYPIEVNRNGHAYELLIDRLDSEGQTILLVFVYELNLHHQRYEHKATSTRMRSMAELTNRIAHDMNNLLSGTLGFSSYLKGKVNKDDVIHKQLDLIEASALRGRDMTEHLLAFSRRRRDRRQKADLHEITNELCQQFARQFSINIKASIQENLPPLVGNTKKIRTALSNVLQNACEAVGKTADREISVTAHTHSLTDEEKYIYNRPDDTRDYALIIFKDSGDGMPEEIRDQILHPYVTGKSASGKTGLGLAIAHAIIDDHEGMISFSCEENGTTVSLLLPYRELDTSSPSISTLPSSPRGSTIRGTETILLVDDEQIIRRMMSSLLPRFGYSVRTAESGTCPA